MSGTSQANGYPEGWIEGQVTIAGDKDDQRVPGLMHERAPGLAVTMLTFGRFVVTHTASGRRVAGHWERSGTACLVMARLARLLDWTQDGDALAAELKERGDEPVPFPNCTITENGETRPCTVEEYLTTMRGPAVELPWEAPADEPLNMACELLDEADARTPTDSAVPNEETP